MYMSRLRTMALTTDYNGRVLYQNGGMHEALMRGVYLIGKIFYLRRSAPAPTGNVLDQVKLCRSSYKYCPGNMTSYRKILEQMPEVLL